MRGPDQGQSLPRSISWRTHQRLLGERPEPRKYGMQAITRQVMEMQAELQHLRTQVHMLESASEDQSETLETLMDAAEISPTTEDVAARKLPLSRECSVSPSLLIERLIRATYRRIRAPGGTDQQQRSST